MTEGIKLLILNGIQRTQRKEKKLDMTEASLWKSGGDEEKEENVEIVEKTIITIRKRSKG